MHFSGIKIDHLLADCDRPGFTQLVSTLYWRDTIGVALAMGIIAMGNKYTYFTTCAIVLG